MATQLTRAEYAILTWAESEAKASLGNQTGGPNEAKHREKLARLRKVMIKLKEK